MLFEEESSSREDTTKGWRRDNGRGGGGEAVYTRGIPNDFGGFFGTATRDREGPRVVEVPKVAARRKEAERGRERGSSRAQRFLRLTSSRLAFYLGQTGNSAKCID